VGSGYHAGQQELGLIAKTIIFEIKRQLEMIEKGEKIMTIYTESAYRLKEAINFYRKKEK